MSAPVVVASIMVEVDVHAALKPFHSWSGCVLIFDKAQGACFLSFSFSLLMQMQMLDSYNILLLHQ